MEEKKNFFYRNIPNFITGIRLVAAIVMIFLEALTLPFFLVYGICGLSDALDGFLARKLKVSSKVGSMLDSIADLLFYFVMMMKILPVMAELLEWQHWMIIIIPTILHLLAYLICMIKFKKFSSLHTYANKVLSFLVFAFPFFFIGKIYDLYNTYIYIGGIFALYSSLEINIIHLFAKEYDERNKSIFLINKKSN